MKDKMIYISEIPFMVDTKNESIKTKELPGFIITKEEMKDEGKYYSLLLDQDSRKPVEELRNVLAPRAPFAVNLPKEIFTDSFWGKQDRINVFNTMSAESEWPILAVDEKLGERLAGRLNTVDIEGHTFYVDLSMDMLRPKDDFLSKGIPFKDINDYRSIDTTKYRIPYDPGKREFSEIYLREVDVMPEHLIMIEFPVEHFLDPVGFARIYDVDLLTLIGQRPFIADFEAKRIDWKEAKKEQAMTVKPPNYKHGRIESPRANIRYRRGRGI